jgi:hypothetical protein
VCWCVHHGDLSLIVTVSRCGFVSFCFCFKSSFVMSLSSSYIIKFVFLLLFILSDISFNTIIDHSNNQSTIIALTAAQCIIRFCSIFLIFIYMSSTFVFKYGLLGILCNKFRVLFICFPMCLSFTLAIRISRIMKINQSNTIQLWDSTYYTPLFVIHNLFSCLFYILLFQSTFDLANPNLFKANQWLHY